MYQNIHSMFPPDVTIYITINLRAILAPLGLPSLGLLHLTSLGLVVILPLTPFSLLLVYSITLSMASWILGYGFMTACSVMPIWPLFEFI